MKKIISIFLVAIMIMSSFTLIAFADTKNGNSLSEDKLCTIKNDKEGNLIINLSATKTQYENAFYFDQWRVGDSIKSTQVYCKNRTVLTDKTTTITIAKRNASITGSCEFYLARYGYNGVTKTQTINAVFRFKCRLTEGKILVQSIEGYILMGTPKKITEQMFSKAAIKINSGIVSIVGYSRTYDTYSVVKKSFITPGKLLEAVKAGNPDEIVSVFWTQYIPEKFNQAVVYSQNGSLSASDFECKAKNEASVIVRKDEDTRWYIGENNGEVDENGNAISYRGKDNVIWIRKNTESNGMKYDILKTGTGKTSVAIGLYKRAKSAYVISGIMIFSIEVSKDGITKISVPVMYINGQYGTSNLTYDKGMGVGIFNLEPQRRILTESQFKDLYELYGLKRSYGLI